MVASVEGLSSKVLNDCLRKNVEFGVLRRTAYSELPPRVEYSFTDLGNELLDVFVGIKAIEERIRERFESSNS